MALEIYYNTGDDAYSNSTPSYDTEQTFTTVDGFTVGSIKFKGSRSATGVTITFGIYATSGGHSTGVALSTGTMLSTSMTNDTDGEWYEVVMSHVALNAATQYALRVSVDADYFSWRRDNSGSYAGGYMSLRNTGTGAFTEFTAIDQMFEIYSAAATEDIDISGTIAAISTISGDITVGTEISISGTIEAISSLSGDITVTGYTDISGTIEATSELSGTLTVASNWRTSETVRIKRLVAAGNDQIWFEDI